MSKYLCKKCGREITPNMKFCKYCGTHLQVVKSLRRKRKTSNIRWSPGYNHKAIISAMINSYNTCRREMTS